MTRETCCTSIPRDHTSVVINTRLYREGREKGEGGRGRREGSREESEEGTSEQWTKCSSPNVSLFVGSSVFHDHTGELRG